MVGSRGLRRKLILGEQKLSLQGSCCLDYKLHLTLEDLKALRVEGGKSMQQKIVSHSQHCEWRAGPMSRPCENTQEVITFVNCLAQSLQHEKVPSYSSRDMLNTSRRWNECLPIKLSTSSLFPSSSFLLSLLLNPAEKIRIQTPKAHINYFPQINTALEASWREEKSLTTVENLSVCNLRS